PAWAPDLVAACPFAAVAAEDAPTRSWNARFFQIQCCVGSRAACQGADVRFAGREDAGESKACDGDADFRPRRCDCAVAFAGWVDFQRSRFFDGYIVVPAFREGQGAEFSLGCDPGTVALDPAFCDRPVAGDVDHAM